MGSFAKHMILCHTNMTVTGASTHDRRRGQPQHRYAPIHALTQLPGDDQEEEEAAASASRPVRRRSGIVSTMMVAAATAMEGARRPAAIARADQSWGTRSLMREKYFQPALSPEDAVARIRQTAEGLREMRHMLDTMSWRYVMFYIRLKSAYLDADLKNAFSTVPSARRNSYIQTANQLVDNMSELDRYVRSPKVYESYVYYEKTLKSLDELVALLA